MDNSQTHSLIMRARAKSHVTRHSRHPWARHSFIFMAVLWRKVLIPMGHEEPCPGPHCSQIPKSQDLNFGLPQLESAF